jgi:hypothetical protein
MGDVIAGLTRQGWDVALRQFPHGWRPNLYPTAPPIPSSLRPAWEVTPLRCSRPGGQHSAISADCRGSVPVGPAAGAGPSPG